jgi:hypothetical protein
MTKWEPDFVVWFLLLFQDLMSYMVIVSDPFQLCHLTKALLIDSASHLTKASKDGWIGIRHIILLPI